MVYAPEAAPRAALPPGALTVGEVVGINANQGAFYLRTRTGYRLVRTGLAPILLHGEPVTLADVAIGDTVAVQREALAPGLPLTVQLVAVFPGQTVAQVTRQYRPLPTTLAAAPPAATALAASSAP
ncbi:MAG: hypothetical protein HY320_16310 [Armatimonadetes bacterium]|nr:hypothetical protein [Armatimonadota bacterium]